MRGRSHDSHFPKWAASYLTIVSPSWSLPPSIPKVAMCHLLQLRFVQKHFEAVTGGAPMTIKRGIYLRVGRENKGTRRQFILERPSVKSQLGNQKSAGLKS
jgi:hypothetical protein